MELEQWTRCLQFRTLTSIHLQVLNHKMDKVTLNVSQPQASLSTVSDIVINTPTSTESQNRHSNSQNNVSQPQASLSNDQTPSNDVYTFNENVDPPPFPDGYASSSDDDNHSENDQIDYLLESDDNDDDEEAVGDIPPIRIPLENYG